MGEIIYKQVPLFVTTQPTARLGLIIVQEWWGLTPHIKEITQRFADLLDAIAVSPDLYRGKSTTKPDEATHLMSGMDWPTAVQDIASAAEYLRSRGCQKVAVSGFCMGGAIALAASIKHPNLIDAGVVFYGVPSRKFADPKELSIPVQYHFGNNDHAKGFSDKETADELKSYLIANGKDVSQFFQYEADHAFMNDTAPAYPYNEPVAKEATANMVAFLKAL